MKYLIFTITMLAVILSVSACDNLNLNPTGEFTSTDVWTEPDLTEAYINEIYNSLSWGPAGNAINVDESRSRSQAGWQVNNNEITSDNSGFGSYSWRYTNIRKANNFLEQMDQIEYEQMSQDEQSRLVGRMEGEVRFLRAKLYFNLLRYLGGVPLITHVYDLGEEYEVPRDSFADVIDFIVEELEAAANLLPLHMTGGNVGRATEGAAKALKSRVLLYAASDLYNPDKNGAVTSGYSNPELLGYTTSNAEERWQIAQDAAKDVIDMGIYSLHEPNPSSAEEASENYYQLFISKTSSEDIFVRFRSQAAGEGVNGWAYAPNGWWANAGVGAIVELVEDYRMADGSKFNREDWENLERPFENRDPRFYGTILYEGAEYRQRPEGFREYGPEGHRGNVTQFGSWEMWDDENNEMYILPGLDTRDSPVNSWNGNRSHATMFKFLDRSVDIEGSNQDLTWRYIRYGEILLNHAEASIELGQYAEARESINKIRQRAFMPDITLSGDELREEYRNERRIELVYEDHRFYDVRRWMIGPEAYTPVHGFDIKYELQDDNTTAEIPTINLREIYGGQWGNRMYFYPFQRDEMARNPQLIQNPGYD